jgi:uncharacterized protein
MWLFVIIFLSLYTGTHLYAFLRARAAFGFGRRAGVMLALFFGLMIFAPIIVRLSENSGFDLFAVVMSYVGNIWMGGMFFFFFASLLTDLYRLIIHIGYSAISKGILKLSLSAKAAFMIPFALSLAVAAYAYYEAADIRTEHITIETRKLPPGVDRLRIAQISDVHVGLLVRGDRIAHILQKVGEAKPDMLVSTGDLLDGQLDGVSEFTGYFRAFNPRLGKYAIMGNHEYIAGIDRAIEFTELSGFRILRNSGVTIDNTVTLIGIDDPAIFRFNGQKLPPEKSILSQFPRDRFTILLKHRPEVDPESAGLFDLQLSGHTHKGQFFPFSIATYLYYGGHDSGLTNINGSLRYINRGAGTAGPPMRFLAPPEVTVIDIVRKK